MQLAVPVGEQPIKPGPVGHVDVPHPVEPAPPRLGRGVGPRDEVAEDVPARARLAEGEGLVEEAHQLGGDLLLLDRAAPGDIAGVERLDLGQQPAARLRTRAVGADQEVRLDLAALREAQP